MNYEQVSSLADGQFKRLTGVKQETFSVMVTIVQTAYDEKHKRRGRNSTLSVEDMVLLMLNYLRSYSTFFENGVIFGVSESSAHRIATWVEDVLISSGTFSLPSKKVLLEEDSAIEIVLIDATEQEIARPKKQRKYYSGKKKKYTLKTQIIVNAQTQEIICVFGESGAVHDFTLYKNTIGHEISTSIQSKADSGYQGIAAFHTNSMIPKKQSKNHPLTQEEKSYNRKLSRERIIFENINAKIKGFRSMSSRYRNRRKRHTLRISLLCGLLNFELRN